MCTVELRDWVGLSEGAVLWESLSKAFKDFKGRTGTL